MTRPITFLCVVGSTITIFDSLVCLVRKCCGMLGVQAAGLEPQVRFTDRDIVFLNTSFIRVG